MLFRSILFGDSEAPPDLDNEREPECFGDLRLDQIVSSIVSGYDEYNLTPYFYAPLRSEGQVAYRHDVFRDLGDHAILLRIHAFAESMRTVREAMKQIDKLSYVRQKHAWLLEAVDAYCNAAEQLTQSLASCHVRSQGLQKLIQYLEAYTGGSSFTALRDEAVALKMELARVRYTLEIVGSRIFVDRHDPEPDYGKEVLENFERFKQGATKAFAFDLPTWSEMNHVEAAILELVVRLYPHIFRALEEFFHRYQSFMDPTIAAFDREVHFYLAYHEFVRKFTESGLSVNYPAVSSLSKQVCGLDVFDLALAHRLLQENARVVTNDFELKTPERIIVVSGPNQGGKTTFARTFGQLHYLASLGCLVPGKTARLFLFDSLFTHFEKEESLQTLRGKLEDDLKRVHQMLSQSTSRSIVILNESFASTSLHDALYLSKQIMTKIVECDMLCVSVTFLDELASFGPTTVSMVSTVLPEDTSKRTFKIIRKPADGHAYTAAIAIKYQLTYEDVMRRITP